MEIRLFVHLPREKYESERTKYSQIIPKIQDPNLTVLRDEYQNLEGMMDPDPTKKSLFENFLATHHDHIHVLFWDQLFGIIEETDSGFLIKYIGEPTTQGQIYV